MYVAMNRTTSTVCKNRTTSRVCKNSTSSRVCKNRTEYIIIGPQVEYLRTGPQVEYVRTGPLVRYVCMTGSLVEYRTRALLGACAYISTGRKCVLKSESVPNNELCIIN